MLTGLLIVLFIFLYVGLGSLVDCELERKYRKIYGDKFVYSYYESFLNILFWPFIITTLFKMRK